MLSLLSRLSVLPQRLQRGALAVVLTVISGGVAMPAFAIQYPDPQPTIAAVPQAYNGDQPGWNAGYLPLACPLGTPGVQQACTGQITVRAQPATIGYIDWHMNGPPILTGTGGTFAVGVPTDGLTCAAVQNNPSGAEPGSGLCTVTNILFTPDGTQPVSLTVTFSWTEQDPDNVDGQYQYTVHNPRLTGPSSIAVPLSNLGTAVPSSLVLLCPETSLVDDNPCGAITLTAQGGVIQIPLDGTFFTDTDQFANSYTDGSGSCSPGLVVVEGASCTTDTFHFTPTSEGAFFDSITLSLVGQTIPITALGEAISPLPTLAPSPLVCRDTVVGQTSSCGPVTITTMTGNTLVNTTKPNNTGGVTVSDPVNYSISAGTCTPQHGVGPGQSCQTGVLLFHPTKSGALPAQVLISSNWDFFNNGRPMPIPVTGTGTVTAGTLTATGSVSCAAVNAGASVTCTNTTTLTASGGPVTLTASPFTNSDSTDFTVALGTCTASSTIASGSSCSPGTIMFNPVTAGAKSGAVTVNATSGTGASFFLSGTSNAFLTMSVSSLSCASTQGVNTTGTCGTIIVTANGGSVTLGAIPFASSDAEFAQALGTCTANLGLISGGTCTTGQLSFTPTSSGVKSTTVTVASSAANATFSASGTGVYGTLVPSVTSIDCSGGVGLSTPCNNGAVITVTAIGGPVLLSASSAVAAQPSATYSIDPGTCTLGLQLAQDETCTTGVVTFKPAAVQSYPAGSVRFVDQNNGASVALTGTGLAYIWNQAGFGSCTNGTWAYTTWAPSTGCGSPITQTRTGTCTAAGAGTQTQAVTCQGIGGTVVADALCVGAGTKPDTNQNCTASPGISCPKEDALTQSATLTNGVGCGTPGGGSTGPGPGAPGGDPSQPAQPGFSWSGGCATFATTCTGGSGLWTVNPSWTPATGTCTETSVQTRAFSCVGKAGSGTQACTAAQCLDSDGNPAPSASCGSLPTGPSCTPTTATCTGTQPANQQQSGPPDHSACPTPSWVSGAFGICTGGSGSFSAWTPLTGCGPATQARTCIPVAGSGTQTQTPTCQWNDGASAPGACIGTGPTTQVCTPGPSSCGAGLLVQALPDCPVTPGSCVSDPAQSHFCVHVPLN